MNPKRKIVIKVPRHVGEKRSKVTTAIGDLTTSPPQVVDGTLVAGRLILVARGIPDREVREFRGTKAYKEDGKLHVYYENEWVTYELIPNPVVWSDGPPHPDHLQLARRLDCSVGVQEPREPDDLPGVE
ncbi:hypothetical protein PBI_MARYV_74 [Mycobacterium phage MaryV]|uniref:Uncharacterized protein n=1 Tax=Mycobacterium phage MaryV TaxID=2656593 RepID=A0A649VDD7_9CAUD|nr:hypothetical protein PBI_MARYV_74 [Mycobacterium phage MaryV]